MKVFRDALLIKCCISYQTIQCVNYDYAISLIAAFLHIKKFATPMPTSKGRIHNIIIFSITIYFYTAEIRGLSICKMISHVSCIFNPPHIAKKIGNQFLPAEPSSIIKISKSLYVWLKRLFSSRWKSHCERVFFMSEVPKECLRHNLFFKFLRLLRQKTPRNDAQRVFQWELIS